MIKKNEQKHCQLSQFRAEIDAIDNKMLNLLKERYSIVQQVGEYKKKSGMANENLSIINPNREAQMLKYINSKALELDIPQSALMQIWRIIITSSVSTEEKTAIGFCVADEDLALAKQEAHKYFGSFNQEFLYKNAKQVKQALASQEINMAIFPAIEHGASINSCWLAEISQFNSNMHVPSNIHRNILGNTNSKDDVSGGNQIMKLSIFARLPFYDYDVCAKQNKEFFVVAKTPPNVNLDYKTYITKDGVFQIAKCDKENITRNAASNIADDIENNNKTILTGGFAAKLKAIGLAVEC